MELINWIPYTKECEECGYVLMRYSKNDNSGLAKSHRKEQDTCPRCNKIVFVIDVRHDGETT